MQYICITTCIKSREDAETHRPRVGAPLRVGQTGPSKGLLYAHVRSGLEAKFNRSSYYEVMNRVELDEETGRYVIRSVGKAFEVEASDVSSAVSDA